jgi:hypothetical protein
MPEKILQVVIYEDEDMKLRELAKDQERSRSAVVRFLINREYRELLSKPAPVQSLSTSERG